MKIKKELVVQFIKSVKRIFPPDELEQNNAYYMDDATVILASDNRLVGIYFETLGQSFNILSSLDLVVSLSDDEDEAYVVDDSSMIDLIHEYLTWRIKVLDELEL